MDAFDDSKLEELLSNDNATRIAAEEYLEAAKAYNPPAFVSFILSKCLEVGLAEPIRVLCLTIMRNQAKLELRAAVTGGSGGSGCEAVAVGGSGVFSSLGCADIERLRLELFTCIQNEGSNLYFMKKVADFLISFNNIHSWDSMIPEICGLMRTTSNVSTMQTCLYLLQKLLEKENFAFVQGLDEHSALMSTVISRSLQDANLKTKSLAVQLFFTFVYRFFSLFESNIPEAELSYCLTILADTVASDEDEAVSILISIHNLVESRAGILEPVWGNLFQLLLSIIHADTIDDEQLKIESIECLTILITSDQSKFCHTQECREGVAKLLMTLMIQTDDAVPSEFWAARPNDEGEFYDEGSCISNIAAVAFENFGLCTSTVSSKANSYFLPLCLQFAEELLSTDGWKNKRGGLLILNSLCETSSKQLYPKMPTIIPAICSLVSSESFDTQYAALSCLDTFIHEYSVIVQSRSEEEEEDGEGESEDENEVEGDVSSSRIKRKGIQELFPVDIPQCLLQHLQHPQVISNPKVLFLTLKCLNSFLDINKCKKKIGKAFSKPLLEFCDALLINEKSLLFCREVTAALIGNVSVFSSRKLMKTYYPRIMSIFKTILAYETSNFQALVPAWSELYSADLSHNVNLDLARFKGTCLKAMTIVGLSVGSDCFYNDAVEMIGTLIQYLSSGSVDYTDPLFSQTLVSCSRIASVIGDKFSQFLPYVLPPLLQFIASPLNEISDTSEGAVTNISEVDDRSLSLKCLYQYVIDIPSLLAPFAPDIIQAVSSLIQNPSLYMDFYLTGLSINYDLIKAFLYFSTQSADSQAVAQQLVNMNLELILKLHKDERSTLSNELANENINCYMDAMRETLVILSDDRDSIRTWALTIEEIYFCRTVEMLKTELIYWNDRHSIAEDMKEEVEEMENDLLAFTTDCFMWLVKLYGRSGADQSFVDLVSFVQTLIPLVDGKYNSNYVIRIKELILRVYADAFENMDMSEAISSWPSIMSLAALRFIDVSDCIVYSLYAIGSSSDALVKAAASNPQNVELLQNIYQFFRVLLYSANKIPVESCPRLWDPDTVDDETQEAILQTSIISLFTLCFSLISTATEVAIPSSSGWPDVHVNCATCISDILKHSVQVLNGEIANVYDIRRFHAFVITQARTYTPALYGAVSEENPGNLMALLEFVVQLLIKVGNPDSDDVSFWGFQVLSERSYLEAKELVKDMIQGRSPFSAAIFSAHFGLLSAKAQEVISKAMTNPDSL